MSFIYAEKYSVDESRRKSIRVLCDTKVTPNNYSAANFSNVSYDLIMNHGYGIIKSTIICPKICVSLAGTDEIFSGLGEMYVADERFRKNIDKAGGDGTAEFACAAIRVKCGNSAEKA